MGLKQKIKNFPALYNILLSVLNKVDYFNWRFNRHFPSYTITPSWQKRIETVVADPDNQKIPRVPMAGQLFPDHQLLHNGLKIALGSYYDYGNTHLLIKNGGVHEPQEEYAFSQVLPFIPANGTMMELGSYWAFYSMWFASEVKGARCFMVEPDPHKMNSGKSNFKLNKLRGTFIPGFLSDHPALQGSIPTYSVDFLSKKHSIDHINIVHSDIQGYELRMLEGCRETVAREGIDYFFISTHGNDLHTACIEKLLSFRYHIVCDATLSESFSVDGLIVAKRTGAEGPERIEISKRN